MLILACLVGLLVGFVLAVPMGPVGFMLIQRTLAGKSGVPVAVRAMVVDVVAVLAAAIYSVRLLQYPRYIYTAGQLHVWGAVQDSLISNCAYSFGFGAGTMMWFQVVLWGTLKLRERFTDYIGIARRIIGFLLIAFAVILAYKLLH
jgi:threonine/homoserine/homoserine lactone efflux protein